MNSVRVSEEEVKDVHAEEVLKKHVIDEKNFLGVPTALDENDMDSPLSHYFINSGRNRFARDIFVRFSRAVISSVIEIDSISLLSKSKNRCFVGALACTDRVSFPFVSFYYIALARSLARSRKNSHNSYLKGTNSPGYRAGER